MVLFPNIDHSRSGDRGSYRALPRAADASIAAFEDSGGTIKPAALFRRARRQRLRCRAAGAVRPTGRHPERSQPLPGGVPQPPATGRPADPAFAPFIRLRDGQTADVMPQLGAAGAFDRSSPPGRAGIARASLTLAWDFVTASNEALHWRHLAHARRCAATGRPRGRCSRSFQTLTRYVPASDGSGRPVDTNIAMGLSTFAAETLRVDAGNFTGSQLNRDGKGVVTAQGTRAPRLLGPHPYSAIDGKEHSARAGLYGHGLLKAPTIRCAVISTARSPAKTTPDLLCRRSYRRGRTTVSRCRPSSLI